ncbi:DnaJ-domain-containing protein [Lentinus brumalis]|uniref:DnaJ-domain-containing protein n=1 Tax=Lentinus brumalis TaxID=2498619 RepID=A0A371CH12_9APHY|nr:DnaJ-domain-containing protein [Polyporus brumalis]
MAALFGLLKYTAWTYLPGLATQQLLSVVHHVYPRVLGRPPPQRGTSDYARDYRLTYLFVVVSYLLYTFYDAAATVEPNYYQILGVEPTADENTLKAAFRQFARRYHPDRVGQQGETLFIQVRDAYEALKSPVKRFAYDSISATDSCKPPDSENITSVVILVILSTSGRSGPVAYWRYLILALTAVYEMLYILNPSPAPASASSFSSTLFADPTAAAHTSLFSFLWPRRVAYQHVRFLHSLFVLASFALSNVVPALFPAPTPEMEAQHIVNEAQQILLQSRAISHEALAQVQTLLHAARNTPGTTFPFLGALPADDGDTVSGALAGELENLLLETQMRADGGPLKSAVENAVERRKRERERERWPRGAFGATPAAEAAWMQRHGIAVGGAANGYASPGRARPGYVRGRSRSLG